MCAVTDQGRKEEAAGCQYPARRRAKGCAGPTSRRYKGEQKSARRHIHYAFQLIVVQFAEATSDKFIPIGILTGRPEEEASSFQGDLLQELSEVYERAWKATRSIVKALWPSASPPGSMEELVKLFKGAQRCFRLWKISACREGA